MIRRKSPRAQRIQGRWPNGKPPSMVILFAVFWALVPSTISSVPQKHSGEVPTASIDCKQDPNSKSEYLCVVVAQCPEGACPQYKWTVPEGTIRGDSTTPNITIDTGQVKDSSLVVTCRVKWKLPAEEITLRKKIDLR